jgi:hypothetical protein
MKLPSSNELGDLPPGVHRTAIEALVERFGQGSEQRRLVTRRLLHILGMAQRTDHLSRLIVFGSYVTDKLNPNDVDVILVMDDEFRLEHCPIEAKGLFDHATAQARYGASISGSGPVFCLVRRSRILSAIGRSNEMDRSVALSRWSYHDIQ